MSEPDRIGATDLAEHLETLALAAQIVARDLRSGLAYLPDGVASSGRALGNRTSGEPPVNLHGDMALLDSKELACLLGVNVRTLRRRRHEDRAPKPLKGAGPLRWRRSDVEKWMQEHAS